MNTVYGNIHSVETFGTVDGPGIRTVIFMQGCPMRCKYCHNPDTWQISDNKKMSVDEILNKYDSIKEFLKNGGITVSGGEPLLQIDFLIELFKKAKEKNIHTALDTSGILFDNSNKYDELIKYTDLVLLDIKHINDDEHKKLTGHSNKSLEVLPYHDMAKKKYKELNIPYPLENTLPATKEQTIKAKEIILNAYKSAKSANRTI